MKAHVILLNDAPQSVTLNLHGAGAEVHRLLVTTNGVVNRPRVWIKEVPLMIEDQPLLMSAEHLLKVERASKLLPDPGPEVVGDLLIELRETRMRLNLALKRLEERKNG